MSSLRSGLEELQSEDLTAVESEQLEADLVELERVARVLQAERLRRIAEVDRRGAFRRDGHLSSSGWIASRLGIGSQAATGEVRMARALQDMPLTRAALGAGEVSGQAAHLLVRARETHPVEFVDDERVLLDGARQLRVRDLYRALEHWQQAVDPVGAAEEDELRYQKRFLHISRTLNGTVRLDGELDPETGQCVMTALQSVHDADLRNSKPPDMRSGAQRRADALGEVCRQWMDSGDRPRVAGERPHMTVTVDVESLSGHPSAGSEYAGGERLSPHAARRIACDAAITRVMTSGRSEPIDVGRRTPIVPPVTRRALVVRDRHCTFPGCERPEEWCDAHHVEHWADGGATALSNLILLCRAHHRSIHQPGGFGVRMESGKPAFYRGDGTKLSERAPP
ncbi:MAG: DUF222 domain-containing protein [Actinomycetota bacterium]